MSDAPTAWRVRPGDCRRSSDACDHIGARRWTACGPSPELAERRPRRAQNEPPATGEMMIVVEVFFPIAVLVLFALLAARFGYDSRATIDDPPRAGLWIAPLRGAAANGARPQHATSLVVRRSNRDPMPIGTFARMLTREEDLALEPFRFDDLARLPGTSLPRCRLPGDVASAAHSLFRCHRGGDLRDREPLGPKPGRRTL